MSYNNGENIPHSIAAAGQYHRIQEKRRYKMNTTRKIAVITGVVFIIATVASLVATALPTPVLNGTDSLTRFSAHSNQVAAGALLSLIAYFASAGIAVVMYPVLKKWNAGLALGSVVFS